jgi:hypothetical protein
MRKFAGPLKIAGVVPAVAAFWLCTAQPARAGDGADLGSLQVYIDAVCSVWGLSTCPQIPTITQAVLQVAAFEDIAPEAVRSSTAFAIPVGPFVDAGNPSHPPGLQCLSTSSTPCVDPLNPISGLPVDPSVLSSLRPLAFVSATSGTAAPTQLYDPSANAFLYAAGGLSVANKGSPRPDTLVLFYDDPTRTNTLSPGQVAAKISLPLTVLNKDGTERPVPAILQYQVPATGAAPCSASTVTGNFSGNGTQTVSPAKIGVDCALVFATSPVSPFSHAIFEVTVPFLITPSTDPAITNGSPLGFGAPFHAGDFGFTFASGKSIGIGPNAAPAPATQFTCDPTGCSYPALPPASSASYALCASLSTNASGNTPLPSVAAFYAIAGDGEVLLSAPLAPSIPHVCPAM